MGKKILFAVMALLVMATGKIWAEGETTEQKPTAYALLHSNEGSTTYTMYFVYTTTTVNATGGEITVEIEGGSSSDNPSPDKKNIKYTKAWEIYPANIEFPEWNSATEKGSITQVVFEKSFKDFNVTSCNNWFSDFTGLTRIKGIEYLDTSEVTNMVNMFYGCSSLTELDLSSFNTSGAANTISMFQDCSSLEKITFGNNFKTRNTQSMFDGCSKLASLNLSSFNTSQVENMRSMFQGCKALTSLDLSSFNTSSVTDMSYMFDDCSSRLTLTIGSFDMSRTEQYNNMFDTNTYIKIEGNALVFVTSDNQKKIWENKTGVNLMVKKDGADKYEGDGTVDITLNNDEDTPVIFPYNFTANNVTFTRTFAAGKPHTVCLPFAITNTTEYGTFYELSGYDKVNRTVKFTKVEGATEANKPYLFIPDKNKADVTKIEVKDDVDISSTKYVKNYDINDNGTLIGGFRGVYEKLTFTEEYLKNSLYDYYGWTAAGDFKRATAGASVAPCRAYIRLKKKTTGGSAPARLSVEFDDGETTGISSTVSGADGGADAPMYNLQGQRVGSGYKGVVIKNGKKMIVR